jgi:hypothetical protein
MHVLQPQDLKMAHSSRFLVDVKTQILGVKVPPKGFMHANNRISRLRFEKRTSW